MSRLSRFLFTAFVLGLLGGCHGFRAADEPTDSTAAIALAQRFLTDLDTGKIEDLIAISDVPFWGDGDYLSSAEAFEAVALLFKASAELYEVIYFSVENQDQAVIFV